MEKYFGNAYRGDPGVPHATPTRFWNIWIGCATFSALTWFNPYLWHFNNGYNMSGILGFGTSLCVCYTLLRISLSTERSWHDRAFLHEQYNWKKAKANNQPIIPYKSHWNEMGKDWRESYYYNWRHFFR